jgi:hypothetical protein
MTMKSAIAASERIYSTVTEFIVMAIVIAIAVLIHYLQRDRPQPEQKQSRFRVFY